MVTNANDDAKVKAMIVVAKPTISRTIGMKETKKKHVESQQNNVRTTNILVKLSIRKLGDVEISQPENCY